MTRAPSWAARLALLVVFLVAVALRFWAPGADLPLAVSGSNAELTDGGWYLAQLLDERRSLDPSAPGHYAKPILNALVAPFVGTSVSTAEIHTVVAGCSALVVICLAGAATTAYGTSVGLLAAVFAATGFLFVGYGRAFTVYGPLALMLSLVAWAAMVGLRRPVAMVAAACALLAAVVWLKISAVILAPALIAGWWVRRRRSWHARLAMCLAVCVGAGLCWLLAPEVVRQGVDKLHNYFGNAAPRSILARWLGTPFLSGMSQKMPVICALAWGGVLLTAGGQAASRHSARWRQRYGADVFFALWLFSWGAFHAVFEYLEGGSGPPLRYLYGGILPAAVLAARFVVAAAGRRGLVLRLRAVPTFAWMLLASYWFLGTAWSVVLANATRDGRATDQLINLLVQLPAMLAVASMLAVGVAVCWTRLGTWRLRIPKLVLGGIVALAVGLSMARWVPLLAHPTYTLAHANRLTGSLLADGARLYGPWAHALTWGDTGIHRFLPNRSPEGFVADARKQTHLAIDKFWLGKALPLFTSRGIALIPLVEFRIRRHAVVVFRFPWAEQLGYRLSRYEDNLERRRQAALEKRARGR